jgi:hypothetical protein
MRLLIGALAAVLAALPAGAATDFVPSARQPFDGFIAINAPRADVPVGALWVDGFGPIGNGAATDNLETVRSLNGMSIDKSMQVSLSAGLLSMIGIDPRMRDRTTAHFTDLSIVRVKDLSKLPGPKGEPRITEAVRAGAITVSSDAELGINAQSLGFTTRKIEGNGTSGRLRSYAIEGRDMFIAIRVSTPMLSESKEVELDLDRSGESARIDNYRIDVRNGACVTKTKADCQPMFAAVKLNSYPTPAADAFVGLDARSEVSLALSVPIADQKGGLYDSLGLRWVPPCDMEKTAGCGRRPRLFATYRGTRLEDFKTVQAKGW